MRAEAAALCCLLGLLPGLSACAGGQGRGVAVPAAAPQGVEESPLAPFILAAVRSMPVGGGYAADRAAELRLAEQGITWRGGRLRISPTGASPTFCSAACYMVLLRALRAWEQRRSRELPESVWHSLRVEPQHPDGFLSWGRVNANGPGFAKWVHDLGAGYSFCSVEAARPGDFLKFFHTSAIGARERGHMVIYLGLVERGGQPCIRYWSSNKPGGYGEGTIPLAGVHHPIFTRITHPERIAAALALPAYDPWLGSLLTRESSYAEVQAKCNLRAK